MSLQCICIHCIIAQRSFSSLTSKGSPGPATRTLGYPRLWLASCSIISASDMGKAAHIPWIKQGEHRKPELCPLDLEGTRNLKVLFLATIVTCGLRSFSSGVRCLEEIGAILPDKAAQSLPGRSPRTLERLQHNQAAEYEWEPVGRAAQHVWGRVGTGASFQPWVGGGAWLCLSPLFCLLHFGNPETGEPYALNRFFYFFLLPLQPPIHFGIFFSFYITCSLHGDKNVMHWVKVGKNQGTRDTEAKKTASCLCDASSLPASGTCRVTGHLAN